MSIPRRISVSCPNCGKNFETTIFESLNTDFAPDVIETVISGERFAGKCLNCGFEAHLEYDMLYHDMKHGAAIWVVHDNGPEYARKVAEVRETELLPYAMTRIVPNMDALREKAACLESGRMTGSSSCARCFWCRRRVRRCRILNSEMPFTPIAMGKTSYFSMALPEKRLHTS